MSGLALSLRKEAVVGSSNNCSNLSRGQGNTQVQVLIWIRVGPLLLQDFLVYGLV